MPTDGVPLEVKVDIHVFAETAWVIISVCLCVAERLKDRVGLNEDIFNSEKESVD